MSVRDVVDPPARGTRGPSRWNWVSFVCGFALFSLLFFFQLSMPFAERFWPHMIESLVMGALCGFLVGRFGDSALARLLSILRWSL